MKRLATSVLVSLATLGAAAQTDPARPRLVVGIVVDQLRTDYIEYLQSYFGERGFKTLLNDAVYMRDVDFKVSRLDAASATAMLYTGAYPAETGVPAGLIYDATSPVSSPQLPLVSGSGSNITNDSFSPSGLRLSTIADELVVDAGGVSQVYSVATDPQLAVIMSGHAGRGAVWINNSSGNWATTSYYGTLPSVVSNRNFRRSLSQRIDTMVWRPSASLTLLPGLSEKKRVNPFKHTFSRHDRDVYKKFAASALSNVEVTDVAIDLLSSLNLGNNPDGMDMLNVAYTLAPFKYVSDGVTRAELTDSYLRLDGQLARLFEAVDRCVGAGNSVIWLTSTGYYDEAVPVDERYRIPGGEFSSRRARSLLNSYLSARFGQTGYVSAIRDGQVYFDRHAIESMRLDADAVINEARAFLVKMSGVSDALTINDILSHSQPEEQSLRLALDPRTCGDIIVRFTPGWSVVYDEQIPSVTKYVRESRVMTPAFILAPGLDSKIIMTPVEATALAPTVAGAVRIRAPNGARSRGLGLK